MDGTNWGAPIAEGKGAGTRTMISFKPARAKFVRITQTGTEADSPAWTVASLRLYEVR
jgi:hypothetical protein